MSTAEQLILQRVQEQPDEVVSAISLLCDWIAKHQTTRGEHTSSAENRYYEGMYDALSLLATGTTGGYAGWRTLCGELQDVNQDMLNAISEAGFATKH